MARAYLAMSPEPVDGVGSVLLVKTLFLRAGGAVSSCPMWHARRDSNPQPAVLETAALPIELLAYRNLASGIATLLPKKATAACAACLYPAPFLRTGTEETQGYAHALACAP